MLGKNKIIDKAMGQASEGLEKYLKQIVDNMNTTNDNLNIINENIIELKNELERIKNNTSL